MEPIGFSIRNDGKDGGDVLILCSVPITPSNRNDVVTEFKAWKDAGGLSSAKFPTERFLVLGHADVWELSLDQTTFAPLD